MIDLYRVAFNFGLCGLLHAAYSATQHRSYIRLTEQEFQSLPIDIVFQSIFSFVLVCIGLVSIAGSLKEIEAAAEFRDKTWDSLRNRSSFYTFCHRKFKLSTSH